MKPRKINKNKIVALCFVLSMLLTSLATYHFVKGSFSGSLEDLPYYVGAPFPYDYIISKNSTHYFAFNGTTGENSYSSTNASYIIQTALDNAESSVHVKNGTYLLSTSVSIDERVIFEGEGDNTILKQDNDANLISLVNATASSVVIQNFELDGNKANNSENTTAIWLHEDTAKTRVINNRIHDFGGYGLRVDGSTEVGGVGALVVSENLIYYTNWEGMYADHMEESFLTSNDFGGSSAQNYSKASVKLTYCSYIHIIGNRFVEGDSGLYLDAVSYSTIAGNTFDSNVELHIQLSSSEYSVIIGNIGIHECKKFVYMYKSNNNTILGNTVNGLTQQGVYEDSYSDGSDYNQIKNNNFNGGLYLTGDHTTSFGNVLNGKPTENQGTQTCADNEDIAHGLAGTPTSIQVDSMNATYDSVPVIVNVDWTGVDSTNVNVGVYWTNGTAISGDIILISWSAKYEP